MQASAVRKVVGSAAHSSRMAFRAARYGCVRCANRLSSALLNALGRKPAVSAAAAAGSPIYGMPQGASVLLVALPGFTLVLALRHSRDVSAS